MYKKTVGIMLGAIGFAWGNAGDLRVIITNNTADAVVLTVISQDLLKEESAQQLAPKEVVDMIIPYGNYRITFRNTVHNKTVAVDRSTLGNVSNVCVAVTLTPGLYPGEPYVGFSPVCDKK